MGGCQNHGPLLGPLNTRCRIILRTQTGAIILTTTHIINLYLHLHLYPNPLLIWTPKSDHNMSIQVCPANFKGDDSSLGSAGVPLTERFKEPSQRALVKP